jgi:5-(carboxyamino)imidazole ribonucleotide synthase
MPAPTDPPDSSSALPPGSTVGIVGTGQLGRMLALAARRMGYRAITTGDDPPGSPCGQVAEPVEELGEFLRRADVVTTEFENVDAAVLDAARLARPAGAVVATCQNRRREKAFLVDAGLPVVRHRVIDASRTARDELEAFGLPAVVKTAAFGYDGKGQWVLRAPADRAAVPLDRAPFVVEELVELAAEVSVVVARAATGESACYPVIQNWHAEHILDVSVAPAAVQPAVAARAEALARRVADALGAVGVLCVEFFLLAGGDLVVNEIAPRPHNSGHLTIEAAPTSQFEQQLRTVCGLPLGAVAPFRPAAMANLLGDLWAGGEPDWAAALRVPGVALHLYGKAEARPGRKMGHLTVVASTVGEALELVGDARHRLTARQ